MSFTILRQPSALIPFVMSLIATGFLVGYVLLVGVARHEDEGAAARFWQLLMAGQLPVIGYFALRWLPRRPLEALFVLSAQGAAWVAAVVSVVLLER